MKKLLLLTFFTLLLSISNILVAQKVDPQILISKADRYSTDDKVLMLEGNVAVSADKLKISKADRIIFDKKLNKIIAYGASEFLFSGTMVIAPATDGKNTRLEYTLGEDAAYIKSYN